VPVSLFMDENVPKAITIGLRLRDVDIITAQEAGISGKSDPEVLNKACEYRRVLFSFDDDLLVEARKRQIKGITFYGVIYTHPLRISIGDCVRDLEIIAKAGELEDMRNRVEFLPLCRY